MEQRLAEFRESRRRARLAAEPSTPSRSAGTSEAAETPQAAPGWLTRLLGWQPRAVNARRQQPGLAQDATAPAAVAEPQRDTAGPTPPPPPWDHSLLTNITFLKVLLWLVLLGLFVELEFGLVYFVLSLFYWMYVGTRGPEERREGEKSAYSVFNPGCEAIQGTLTAEQLERDLQLRPSVGS